MMKRLMQRAGGVALSGVLGLMAATTAYGADPILIGSVLSVTGPAAFLGDPELKTLQLYVEKINQEGGVLGRKLELVHYDDGSDPNAAIGFTKRLIDSDKVDVLISGTTTGSTMSVVPLVERTGIPFISLAGAAVVIEPVKKWVFKTSHTDRMAVERALNDMKKRGLTKVALLSETSGFGQSGRKETEAVVKTLGMTLVANETYGAKDTDMTPQLTKIRNTPGVEALYVFGLGQGPAIVNKNIRMLGLTLPVYHSHGVASEEFIHLSGPAAEGVRLPAGAVLIPNKLPDGDRQKPVVADFTRTYHDRYKEDVSTFGGHAYDALLILVDALKRANSTDRAKLRDAIEQTTDLVGADGIFNMTPTDHMGLSASAFRLLEVKNGDWVLID
ncbi:MAG: ABC transporter substrate-binding protein [Alphaproteobacteria bacterium]|nr:ABC transporter substrate-binding protein [Alphaproteobacteria bacterium]